MIDRVKTEKDRSPPKDTLPCPKTPPFGEYQKGNPFENVSAINSSTFAGKIVSQKQRMSLSTAIDRKERVKDN